MKKLIEIDDLSKARILAAFDIYDIGPNTKICVRDSYREDGYNVYSFADFFSIGLKAKGNVIQQKFMEYKTDVNHISRKNFKKESPYVNETFPLTNEVNDKKFKDALQKINSAISEYITRDNLYERYKIAKVNQLDAIRVSIIEQIETHKEDIERLMSKKLSFHPREDSYNGDDLLDLEIKAYYKIVNDRYIFYYTIARTEENFNKLISNSRIITRDNQMMRVLYRFILIVCYYYSEEAFENIFSESVNLRNQTPQEMLKNLFSRSAMSSSMIYRPLRESYRSSNRTASPFRLVNFNYDLVTNVEHLKMIYDTYETLVEAHKKYINVDIKDMELNLFGLDEYLMGSKSTNIVLKEVLKIDVLKERIALLESSR